MTTTSSQLDKATSLLAIPLGLLDGHPNWRSMINSQPLLQAAERATAPKTLYEDMSEAQRDTLLAAFAAQYLPQLIEAFLGTAPVIQDESPWSHAVLTLLDNIYFAKFISKHEEGPKLYGKVCQIFVDMNLANLRFRTSYTATLSRIHNFLVVYYSHHANYSVELPDDTRGQIRDVCDSLVAHIYAPKLQSGSSLSVVEKRRLENEAHCLMQTFYFFKGTTQPKDMLGAVGKMMPGWTCQALDTGCWRKGPLSGDAAKTCSRCKAATYCGEAHQAQDWKAGHKRCCFATTW